MPLLAVLASIFVESDDYAVPAPRTAVTVFTAQFRGHGHGHLGHGQEFGSIVKSHIHNTFKKLNVKSCSEIICLIHDETYISASYKDEEDSDTPTTDRKSVV